MKNNLSAWQRFKSETPLFFKCAQLIGFIITAIGSSLSELETVPHDLTAAIISFGSAIVIISQFSVKQSLNLKQTHHDSE
ncbi:hypothetical protein FPZ43_15650 [Mucilaginibacter pallidiroseus]|uniref:Uncharacterized protein n=1 Tax=Mucilaginibacter pallidiroseus TaxID=2599295 RepID=A0A563U2Z5_9SPHI|nr:hypothetical protein [Mucilaginibacter pallidiroseus]TWR25719.1 hypothetical protein FPZ43_15650 [Mucilaginibacter pallidiroseus]